MTKGGFSMRAAAAATASVAVLSTGLLGTAPATVSPAAMSPTAGTLPPIRHVFVVMLENESSTSTFGDPGADPYLATQLRALGAYIPNYYGTGHASNDNYVSLVSGQGPNPQNQGDCQIYSNFVGSGPVVSGTGTPLDGQAVGSGCVFPPSVSTIANQLTSAHLSWKGYMEDMGGVPSREAPVCGHPALDAQDHTQSAVAGDGYVSRHDPFVYFHSIIDGSTYCDAHVEPLGSPTGALPVGAPVGTTGLATDLASPNTTANLSFIVPDVCDDGHDFPCTNEATPATSAVGDIDVFLKTWIPKILKSPAFHRDGMLVITFDEGAFPGDATACCNEGPGPNTPLPGVEGLGGGEVGALVLSPFVKGGTVSPVSYNHYSLLGSIEDLFGLSRLGYAADVPATFGRDIYTSS